MLTCSLFLPALIPVKTVPTQAQLFDLLIEIEFVISYDDRRNRACMGSINRHLICMHEKE
jgi:hypothetical protein